MDIDPTDYVCGGYFLVKRIPRPANITDLLPDPLLTISKCFADIAPDSWAMNGYNYSDDERAAEALKFHIPASALKHLVSLFTRETGSLEANAFPNLFVAQEFYRECADKSEIVLLAIGLESSLLPSLHGQLEEDVNRGYGLIERVEQNHPLGRGGEPLGYEPLGYDALGFHSWLCHNAPVEAYERFGIRPNSAGFIDSFDDAVKVTEDLRATGAEQSMWEPWLVVQYDNLRCV
jgi:hypothetical protein